MKSVMLSSSGLKKVPSRLSYYRLAVQPATCLAQVAGFLLSGGLRRGLSRLERGGGAHLLRHLYLFCIAAGESE